jgi:large subunit ribosomal protein L21
MPTIFAVIEDGSHQYRVQQGETLTVEYRSQVKSGETISFDHVLLANAGGSSAIGSPIIDGAIVEAEVLKPEVKGLKIEVQKIRRRKNSRRHTGHRQKYTSVRITEINVPGLEIVEPPVSTTAQSAEPTE